MALATSIQATPVRSRHHGKAIALLLVLCVVAAGVWALRSAGLGALSLREHCLTAVGGNVSDLDPEQAGNAAVIAAVSVHRKLPGRATTIAIATAMQESKLRNLDYGDRDSVGLFQQRPSQGWGTRAQVHDPVYASNAFYNALVKIAGYRTLDIATAAQHVQHSAYPEAYADHVPAAKVMSSALDGFSPATLTCVLHAAPRTATSSVVGEDGLTSRARALLTAARTETGRTGALTATTNGERGRALTFTVTGKDDSRLRWALASWAVARAQGLGIDQVTVNGRRWSRAHSPSRWTYVNGPATTVVTVLVAR